MNLALLLDRTARRHPRLPALALGATVLCDYAAYAERTARLAAALRETFGLAVGDRVALVMRNCPQYAEALFAIWHAGLTAVPINSKLHARELAFILSDAGAAAVFASREHAATVSAAVAGLNTKVIDSDAGEYLGHTAHRPMPLVARQADDLAWLFYTSGTTGRPKGVMLSHGNILAATQSFLADVAQPAPGDAILHAAPMSHGSGLYAPAHVARAACQITTPGGGFDADECGAALAAHRGVTLFAAPTMVRRLVDVAQSRALPLTGLTTLVYGGGPMYVADCRRALAVLGQQLVQIYGQGESPMTITVLDKRCHADSAHPRYLARLASVGVPFTGIELRVADGEGRSLPAGEAGEILVRGPTVMAGYWNRPQASADTLAGGWLHTGDIGAVDDEGFLTLLDRAKDLIISGGSNIYPREVEEVLLTHPDVAEVSVVGEPDPEWGENVVAFVVARAGAVAAADPLDAHCLAHLARFKRPKRYLFVTDLPKNQTGKVLKTELRQRLSAAADPGRS